MSFITSITTLTQALASEYMNLFNQAQLKPGAESKVKLAYQKLVANKARYEAVSNFFKLPGLPWYLIGIIHMRESSFDFTKHLHNGDPLTRRTVNVPAGRPLFQPSAGPGKPYTWEESAVDAISIMLAESPSWGNYRQDSSVPSLLNKMEAFNGAAYRRLSNPIPSPYLWSDSTLQKPGKFIADNKFSPTTVDQQVGAATLLKYFLEQEAKKKVV